MIPTTSPNCTPLMGVRMTELSFGQKAVGLTFNPSGATEVDWCKQHFADLIDQMNEARDETDSPEKKRLCSIAITQAQTAQMWAVKSLTFES